MAIRKLLDVGTMHLTDKDIDLLHELAEMESEYYDTCRVTNTQHGFVVHLGDEDHIKAEIADAKARGLSDNYQKILAKAFDEGCFLINFDEAGDQLDDIPISED